ncbi:MAG: DUF4364 family protein [Lachnospiraceae bacterium]|nr:DUF4364 family protein [Lachnospiraceae bacterium]MBP5185137.1 DUF4364 family protein [Lachnospiraceae bacterium]
MQNETLMLYKLIILYILDSVDYPLTNTRLTDFIVERNYTNYFNVQQVLAQLVEDGYVSSEVTRNTTTYLITTSGGQALSLFLNDLNPAIRKDIDNYLKDHSYALREEVSYPADYEITNSGDYMTRLTIMERNQPIFELRMSVPNEDDAIRVCNEWERSNMDLYRYAVMKLIGGGH